MTDAELLHRLTKLEATVKRLTQRITELEARPQPAQPIGGAGNNWPWPMPGQYGWKVDCNGTPYRVTTMPCVAIGSDVSYETPKGSNGDVSRK